MLQIAQGDVVKVGLSKLFSGLLSGFQYCLSALTVYLRTRIHEKQIHDNGGSSEILTKDEMKKQITKRRQVILKLYHSLELFLEEEVLI